MLSLSSLRSGWGWGESISNKTMNFVALLALSLLIAVAPVTWTIFTIAGIAALLAALIQPWLLWLVLAFFLPITSAIRYGPASLSDLLLAAAVAFWLVAIVRMRRPLDAPRVPIVLLVVYLLSLYLSTLVATNLDEALTEMVKWAEFGLLLVIVPLALPARFVPWLVAALLSAAAFQGLYGLYQFVYRIGPDWFLIQGRFMRASGLFGQPNPFGGYLGLSLPVAFSLSLWGVEHFWCKRRLATLFWTLFYLAAFLSILAGLIASWSRGAWFGAIAGVVVVLALFNRKTAFLIGSGLLAVLIASLLGAVAPGWMPPSISVRISNIPAFLGLVDVFKMEINDDNFAIIERVAHWVAALRMWELSPWLGVGPGNYAAVYPRVALPPWNDPLGHAHNIYLNVLGETGIIGICAFLLFWSSLVAWLVKELRTRIQAHSWSRALTVGVVGLIAHLAVHSFFDNLFVQGIYLLIAFWLAVVAACINFQKTSRLQNELI